jgi:hypothetical protein
LDFLSFDGLLNHPFNCDGERVVHVEFAFGDDRPLNIVHGFGEQISFNGFIGGFFDEYVEGGVVTVLINLTFKRHIHRWVSFRLMGYLSHGLLLRVNDFYLRLFSMGWVLRSVRTDKLKARGKWFLRVLCFQGFSCS